MPKTAQKEKTHIGKESKNRVGKQLYATLLSSSAKKTEHCLLFWEAFSKHL